MKLQSKSTKEEIAKALVHGIEDALFGTLWLSGVRRVKAPLLIYDWIMVRWQAHSAGVPPHAGDAPSLAWRDALRMWAAFRKQMRKAGEQ